MSSENPTKRRSRREQQTEETRQALLSAAHRLFGGQGYAETAAEEIVSEARVTRGALYHHFPRGKSELFAAVSRDVQARLVRAMKEAASGCGEPWDALLAAIRAYFDGAQDPSYQQIVLRDGPSVLGSEAWRELEQEYSLKLLHEGLERLLAKGLIAPLPPSMVASIIFGACCEATLKIAASRDRETAKADAIDVLTSLLNGLKPQTA